MSGTVGVYVFGYRVLHLIPRMGRWFCYVDWLVVFFCECGVKCVILLDL